VLAKRYLSGARRVLLPWAVRVVWLPWAVRVVWLPWAVRVVWLPSEVPGVWLLSEVPGQQRVQKGVSVRRHLVWAGEAPPPSAEEGQPQPEEAERSLGLE